MIFRKSLMQEIAAVLSGMLLLSGCGSLQDNLENEKDGADLSLSSETQEIGSIESGYSEDSPTEEFQTEESPAEDQSMDEPASEMRQAVPTEKNGVIEIYAGGDAISISQDIMTAKVLPEEILMGNPILYDRYRVDGWVFEWLISDYRDDDNWFFEDGVLVVSRDDSEDVQVISVEAEGGYATWVSMNHKFEYMDVNFDGLSDLLICTGHHGNQGLLTYYCFLQTENGFTEAPTFTEIPNPAIDTENQLILSQWRNFADSHSWAEYKCQDNTYVLYRELREEGVWDSDKNIWIWTVNGEVIGRSDELSEEEINDLIYNENSEWGIGEDRWRTLYNNGLTTDFSIYSEP